MFHSRPWSIDALVVISYLYTVSPLPIVLNHFSDSLPDVSTRKELTAYGEVQDGQSTHPFALVELPIGSGEGSDPWNVGLYKWNCGVYISDHGALARRFTVHAPDREARAIGLRTAKWMAHLWSIADDHFGATPTRLRQNSLDIWLTRSGDPGGEQMRSNIYIYNLGTDRSPVEWVRELSHEYGHYLLPGASGYTDPESWSNGILGERLFLLWTKETLLSKRFLEVDLPFVTLKEIEEYCSLQPEALISQFRDAGPNRVKLSAFDKA